MIDPQLTLWLSGALFCLGIVGVMVRRNAVSGFLGLALMATSSVVALTSFDLIQVQSAAIESQVAGRGFAIMIFSVATAQTFVGLGLLIAKRPHEKQSDEGSAPW